MRVLVVTLALVAGGCAALTPEPNPTPSVHTREVGVYWVADTARGPRLFHELVTLPDTADAATQALAYLTTHGPVDPDYTTLWPSGTEVRDVAISDGVAVVDLAPVRLNVGAEAEYLAIQQLLWTLTEADPSISGMRITVDGMAVESLAGHVDASGMFAKPPTYEVLAPVWISTPAHGAVVGDEVEVRGFAGTFEANVVWELLRDGVRVDGGSTTAAAAAPAWAPWMVTLSGLEPGAYEIRAEEYSAKDGSLVVRDSKAFTVR